MQAPLRHWVKHWGIDLEKFTVVSEFSVVVPKAEDDIECLRGAGSPFTWIEPHQCHVGRNSAQTDPPLEASAS